MHSFIQKLAATFFIISLVTILISCGGGGGSSDTDQVQGKGTVGILLTDKPADPAMFSAIIASIIKIELMPSDENDRFTLFSGGVKEYDLLRLRNESRPLAFKDNVPAGRYCKIRLTLTDLELVLADNTPFDPYDNVTDHPKLPGNGKLDLVARDCFYVAANEVVTLQLDLDMGRSIHIVGNKQGFNFRPVIFVDVVNQDFDSKLVRLNGKIASTNPDRQTLLLCNALPNQHMDNLGCVNVHFGKDSAYFDNIEYQGAPRAIKELLSKDKGTELTVVGWARSWNNADYVDDRSAEYYPLLHLEALVAELGKFLTVEGTVAADADTMGFPMTVTAGGPEITKSTLTVRYQTGDTDDINGTRIVSKSGVLLEPGDAVVPLPTQVDGTKGGDSLLKAALVILDKGALGVKQVTGKILEVYTDSLLLDPEADTVCGVAGPLTVGLSNDLEILTVTITDASSEIAPGGMLEDGQTVNMNGTCEGTNYQTDNIVGIVE